MMQNPLLNVGPYMPEENNIDLNQTPQNAAAGQVVQYLPLIQQFVDTTTGEKKRTLFSYLRIIRVRS